jgi:hypothetical protein
MGRPADCFARLGHNGLRFWAMGPVNQHGARKFRPGRSARVVILRAEIPGMPRPEFYNTVQHCEMQRATIPVRQVPLQCGFPLHEVAQPPHVLHRLRGDQENAERGEDRSRAPASDRCPKLSTLPRTRAPTAGAPANASPAKMGFALKPPGNFNARPVNPCTPTFL